MGRVTKGALTEQYTLQELSSIKGIRSIYYWTSEATAEVDFVFFDGQSVIPAENIKHEISVVRNPIITLFASKQEISSVFHKYVDLCYTKI